LDDDIVINSLSALESGQVDEIVEKINLAQESGLSVGIKVGSNGVGATAEGNKKGSESLQAEYIRRRTRFSVFELWFDGLNSRQGIGTFKGWGVNALDGITPGDVIQITGKVEIVPLQVAFRMYLWFAKQVREKNPMFKDTKPADVLEPERTMKFILGTRDEINATITPQGESGPAVALSFQNQWLIEPISRWAGTYTIIAQVEEVLLEGDSWQTMRIIEDAPLSPMEQATLTKAVEPFREAVGGFGIELDENPTSISGPALVVRPIAMFR